MKINRVHMKIVSIVEEEARNGGMHLRVKAESEGKIYTFGVKEEDYLDKRKRARLQQSWIKTISKAQVRAQRQKKAITDDEEKIQSLVNEEVEESEY